MSTLKKIVIVLTILVVGIPACAFGYFYYKLNSIHENNSDANDILSNTKYEQVEGITNILLVGIDARDISEPSRSDAMMLLTLDTVHKSIKLTSFARDSYVEIPDHGSEKLTHAYAYGGINLLLETIENNFEVDINDYAVVNFFGFVDIINTLGGIEVDVKEDEINELNTYIVNGQAIDKVAEGEDVKTITKSGLQTLNGYQALAFSRIRYTDSAFHREARHREVAESAYKEFAQRGVDTYKRCADIVLNNTKTNISPIEMMNLAYTVLKINDKDIEQFQFPLEEHRKGHIISKQKGWVLEWDKEPNLEAWHKFIFGTE